MSKFICDHCFEPCIIDVKNSNKDIPVELIEAKCLIGIDGKYAGVWKPYSKQPCNKQKNIVDNLIKIIKQFNNADKALANEKKFNKALYSCKTCVWLDGDIKPENSTDVIGVCRLDTAGDKYQYIISTDWCSKHMDEASMQNML